MINANIVLVMNFVKDVLVTMIESQFIQTQMEFVLFVLKTVLLVK